MGKKRYSIGFLFGDFYGAYTANLFRNIVSASREYKQNIISFGGGFLKSPDQSVLGENCNFIFDLVNKNNVDGLIIEGSIGNFIPIKKMQQFLKKYAGIPIVNIGTNIEGVNNILIDNKKGMEELITHLIEYHNYKKIAFLEGTKGNYDAIQRFEAYKNILDRYNIPLDNDLIANGNFTYLDTIKAYKTLFEERKADFEAVVCANDEMAIFIMREMEKYGLKVPDDVAVTGFDDTEECWTVKPTLTTVKQPFYGIGHESVKMLLSILKGNKVPDNIILPTEFIIRESCGCKAADKLNHIRSGKIIKKYSDNKYSIVNDKKAFIKEIITDLDNEFPFLKDKLIIKEWLKDLIDLYCKNINEENNRNIFQEKFLEIFHKLIDCNEEIITINKFISFFYNNLLNRFIKPDEYENVLKLWNETLVLLGFLIKEDLSEKRANFILESHVVFDINENFINTFDIEKLKESILINLLHIQFKSFYVCLFDDKTRETSKILLAYDKEQNKKNSYKSFPSKYLLPSKINKNNQYEYVVMSLNFNDEYFGYIIYNVLTLTCFIYETLSVQISGAIKGALLTKELYEYTTQLESKVKERTLELEKANNKLKELDILKNDFIANITHDFRSPLTAILNITDLALKFNKTLDNENKENYNVIYKASLRLKNSIDKLLELAKMDARGIKLRVKKIDLIQFFNNVLNFYTSSVLNSSIKIIRKLPEREIKNFYTDPEKLQEILDNIISNAIKFVDPNTGIIICKLEEKNKNILISISDNGIGIQKNKLETIFNRFEQAHNGRNSPYRGTGIGLAFSKQLIGYLKGRIWAESEGEGKGAKFNIELKKGKNIFDEIDFSDEEVMLTKHDDAEELIKSEIGLKLIEEKMTTYFTDLNKENETDYKKGIILIIDDDKNVRDIVIKYLKNYGYKNFIVASDGNQGLEAVYEYSPDIIISDFNMPNMRGDEFHNQLIDNPEYKKIPFIFLSAVADENLIIERRLKGAVAYLKKPIDEKIFIITIEEHLKKYFEYLKISKLVIIDELTGLNNRRSMIKTLKHELAVRKYRDLSLISFDLDNFKEINDNFGHQAGDKLLTELGKIIKKSIRNYDIAGRFGGDNFIIIMPDTNLNQASHVANILREIILNIKFEYQNNQLSISSSFGVVSLIENSNYIEKELNIKNLKNIYEIKNIENVDWEKINNYKIRIVDILLKMADTALNKAKQTECKKCGFSSEKLQTFINNKCPKCDNEDLIIGRNKVVAFK